MAARHIERESGHPTLAEGDRAKPGAASLVWPPPRTLERIPDTLSRRTRCQHRRRAHAHGPMRRASCYFRLCGERHGAKQRRRAEKVSWGPSCFLNDRAHKMRRLGREIGFGPRGPRLGGVYRKQVILVYRHDKLSHLRIFGLRHLQKFCRRFPTRHAPP